MSNRINYFAIRAKLDVPHPVSGAWDPDPVIAADQMNELNIDGPVKSSISTSDFWRVIYNQKAEWDTNVPADAQAWITRFAASSETIPTAPGDPVRTILEELLPPPIKQELGSMVSTKISLFDSAHGGRAKNPCNEHHITAALKDQYAGV